MTEMITITFGDASTLDLPVYDGTLKIIYSFPGLEIFRQPNKVGITNDPNQGFRTVTGKAYTTAAVIVDTLDGKLLPASAPTYDATDPKILVTLSGAKTLTILCAVKQVVVSHITQDKYDVDFTFEERST
jgi:hypothetical protein